MLNMKNYINELIDAEVLDVDDALDMLIASNSEQGIRNMLTMHKLMPGDIGGGNFDYMLDEVSTSAEEYIKTLDSVKSFGSDGTAYNIYLDYDSFVIAVEKSDLLDLYSIYCNLVDLDEKCVKKVGNFVFFYNSDIVRGLLNTQFRSLI